MTEKLQVKVIITNILVNNKYRGVHPGSFGVDRHQLQRDLERLVHTPVFHQPMYKEKFILQVCSTTKQGQKATQT